MPLYPLEPPPKRWYETGAFIAAVGALVMAVANLICYLADASVEVHGLVSTVVGAGLAVWKSATGVTDQRPPGPGLSCLLVLVTSGFMLNCAASQLERAAARDYTDAGVSVIKGSLRLAGEERIANVVEASRTQIIEAVQATLNDPVETGALADAICLEASLVIAEFTDNETIIRIPLAVQPIVKRVLDWLLGYIEDRPPPDTASGDG